MSNATIHLSVPAATKGRWVRASRADLPGLPGWLTLPDLPDLPGLPGWLTLPDLPGLLTLAAG